jgi:carbonic anhydrase
MTARIPVSRGGASGTGEGSQAVREAGLAQPVGSDVPTKADLAIHRLLAGNQRFVAGGPIHPRQDRRRVAEVSSGQHPFAVCLGCADSRVPTEILFDEGIGDVFSLRVAGNIVDESVLGSIEYAVEHLHVPLLLVLGHGSCGAVAATVAAYRSGETLNSYLGSLVAAILPAVEPVLDALDPTTPEDVVVRQCAIANVTWVLGQVRSSSHVVAELEAEGTLALAGGFYDLNTAEVSLVG